MVIQRWQSLLLLIAAVVMGCFSFMSLGDLRTVDFTYNFTALGLSPMGERTGGAAGECVSTWYLFAVSLISAVLPLVAIFAYKQFRLQKRLCLLTMLMLVCVTGASAVVAYNTIPAANVEWSALVCAPFIALVAVILAYQRICSDHKKILSMDRLR